MVKQANRVFYDESEEKMLFLPLLFGIWNMEYGDTMVASRRPDGLQGNMWGTDWQLGEYHIIRRWILSF